MITDYNIFHRDCDWIKISFKDQVIKFIVFTSDLFSHDIWTLLITLSNSVKHMSVSFWIHNILATVWTMIEKVVVLRRLAASSRNVRRLIYKVFSEERLSLIWLISWWFHVYQVLFSAHIKSSSYIRVSLNQTLQFLIAIFDLSGSYSSILLLARIKVMIMSLVFAIFLALLVHVRLLVMRNLSHLLHIIVHLLLLKILLVVTIIITSWSHHWMMRETTTEVNTTLSLCCES